MSSPEYPKTRPMLQTEQRLGRDLGEVLRDLYHARGMSLPEVAAELGVSVTTVLRWMTALGVERRFPGQRGKVA